MSGDPALFHGLSSFNFTMYASQTLFINYIFKEWVTRLPHKKVDLQKNPCARCGLLPYATCNNTLSLQDTKKLC